MKNKISLLIMCIISVAFGTVSFAESYDKDKWTFSNYYDPSDREVQGEILESNDKVAIKTNGANVWGNVDSCSVLLSNKKVNFSHEECCKTTLTVTVNSIENAINMNAAAGLVMRTTDDSESSNAMWRVLPDGQTRLTYRSVSGGSTDYVAGPTLMFPAELKLERQGNTIFASYKEKDKWVTLSGIHCTLGEDMYVGMGAFATNEQPITAYFSGFECESSDNYIVAESFTTSNEKYSDDTLLIERFDDSSLINNPESVVNPIWYNGAKYTTFKKNDTKGLAWLRDKVTGTDYVGDTSWTDYEASVDMTFDSSSNGKNIAELIVRARPKFITGFRGDFYYAIGFRDKQLCIMKKYTYWDRGTYNKVAWSSPINYTDGKTRNIKVKVVDNRIDAYIDDVKIFTYIDEYLPNLRGCVGLNYEDGIVWFDNLIVKKVDDLNGGDYDNFLGGNFYNQNKDWYNDIYMR